MQPTERSLIEATEKFVKNSLREAEPGHDWLHAQRVRSLSLKIARFEKAALDYRLLEVAALVHDLYDHKFSDPHDSFRRIKAFFAERPEIDRQFFDQLVYTINNISFSRQKKDEPKPDLIVQILRDADRLDAIGAIGVARAFSYGGYRKRPFYDSDQAKDPGNTLQHFEDKLLKIKDLLYTNAAQNMAGKRHLFLISFLEQFSDEVDQSG